MSHPALLPVEELSAQCELHLGRRGGPGGQHRNKTESAVLLIHKPTGIMGQASERRSQFENRQKALKRLRINLALEYRTPELGDAAPSALWRSRCHQGRLQINPQHADFPALLAEGLEVVLWRNGAHDTSAEQLLITPSQLVKFLRLEPRALALVNAQRVRRGLEPLR